MTNCFISTTFRENHFIQTPLTPTILWLTTVLTKIKCGHLKWLATTNRQCQIFTKVTSTPHQEWTTFHGGLLNLQLPLFTKTRSFRKWCSSGTGEKDLKQSKWSTRWSTTTMTEICGIHRRLKSKVILDGLGINSRKSFWKMCTLRTTNPRPPSTTWTTKKNLTRSTDTRSHSSSTTATLRAHSRRQKRASTSWVHWPKEFSNLCSKLRQTRTECALLRSRMQKSGGWMKKPWEKCMIMRLRGIWSLCQMMLSQMNLGFSSWRT